jgi:diguanylate cyclase (GGDEF)-like protein
MSLVMIDCDNLKRVNDSFGHETGNRLLQHSVDSVRAQLRSTDVLARYGGDEFIALLPETGAQGAREVAERIRRSVETGGLRVRDCIVPTTVSVGVASYPDDGVDIHLLLDKADKAMYRSKQEGRNRSTPAHPEEAELPLPARLRVANSRPE